MTRKRSTYRPRALRNTLSLLAPAPKSAVQQVVARCRQALESARVGGTRANLRYLAEPSNVLEVAVGMGYIPDAGLVVAAEAEGAVLRIERQGMVADPDSAAAIEAAIDVYAQVLGLLTEAEVLGLLQATARAQDQIREAA